MYVNWFGWSLPELWYASPVPGLTSLPGPFVWADTLSYGLMFTFYPGVWR